MPTRVVVAIDGPAGAGKSTIARRVAARLGFTYVDTGAMYRAVALLALRSQTDLSDAARLEELARAAKIEFEPGSARVLLDGEDVTEAIRRPEISPAASQVSVFPGVRRALVEKQRRMGAERSIVMEGRDIGTVVFPDAAVKLYLDADPEVRALRRVRELEEKGQPIDAPGSPPRSTSATAATARAPIRRSPAPPTPSTSIPRRSASTRWSALF